MTFFTHLLSSQQAVVQEHSIASLNRIPSISMEMPPLKMVLNKIINSPTQKSQVMKNIFYHFFNNKCETLKQLILLSFTFNTQIKPIGNIILGLILYNTLLIYSEV